MRKTLLYKLFGIGKLPKNARPKLEGEQILLLDEGLNGSVTYRNYSAPGRQYGLRKVRFTGSLVVTKSRVVGFAYHREIMNLTFEDPRLANVEIRIETDSALCIAFDVSKFNPQRSGQMELRFKTAMAAEIVNYLMRDGGRGEFSFLTQGNRSTFGAT